MRRSSWMVWALCALLAPRDSTAVPPGPSDLGHSPEGVSGAGLDPAARVLGFQALLTDGAGRKLTGLHRLDFWIHDAPTNGNVLYEDRERQVEFRGGVCNTTVGTAENPIPPGVFDRAARYLGVAVDGGAELTPRILLGTNPYTFRADAVDNPELTDDIRAGSALATGTVEVFQAGSEHPMVRIGSVPGGWVSHFNAGGNLISESGVSQQDDGTGYVSCFDRDQVEIIRLWADGDAANNGVSRGQIFVRSAGAGGGGGQVQVMNNDGAPRVLIDGEDHGGGRIDIFQDDGRNGIVLLGEDYAGTGQGTRVIMYNESDEKTVEIDSDRGLTDKAYLFINGDTVATGVKNAAVEVAPGNRRLLYSVESPEVWFEEIGTGRLNGGVAEVVLDALFLRMVTIDDRHPMHVLVTPTGPCNGVYVEKQCDRFAVRELMGGRSDASFDYKVMAKRKGYEDRRLDPLEAAAQDGTGLRTPGEQRVQTTQLTPSGHGQRLGPLGDRPQPSAEAISK